MPASILVLALIVLLPACNNASVDHTEASWQDGVGPLRGLWRIVSYRENGLPQDDDGVVGMEYLFEDNRIILVKNAQVADPEEVYRCRVNESLRQIDWFVDVDEGVPLTMKGIYLLKGDTLTICRAFPDGKRPTKLITEPGDNLGVYELERVKQTSCTNRGS